MNGLKLKNIQVDEIWTFVKKKQKSVKKKEKGKMKLGDQYIFVALDTDTKLIPTYRIGKRNHFTTYEFLNDLSTRIINRFQLSSDSFNAYFNAVDEVYGTVVDYAQIHKHYGEEVIAEKRYSPAKIIDITIKIMLGRPKPEHISTSYVERQNLTMRMQMRRFTRLTNGFSKKLENLDAAVALHFYYYNFMRIHQSPRVTPAMEARITNKIWEWKNLLNYEKINIAA